MIPRCLAQKKLGTPPLSPLKKRKSEGLEKHNGLSPLRRSDIGSESLRSSSSPSKRCVELNEEKKRKKVRLLSQVTMESEKAEAHLEPFVMKRKRMTGHCFKALLKGKCVKKTVSAGLALGQSEKLPSDQGKEEQVHSVDSKKRYLKSIHTLGSRNTIDSGRDHLLAEEDINQETSNVDEQRSPSSSLQLRNVKMNIEKDSAKEEHYETKIFSHQKQALKDEGAQSEIDSLINKIQKKCDKRMKKLIRKQQEKIQEFHQIWEEERLNMEKDHRLELAVIRSIHGQGSARMQDKLKLLDGKFAKKMEEHNLLKDVQLKELETEQLAARNEERQKEAHWLAEAKACRSSELRAVYEPRSLGSQSEKVGGFSQASTHILGAKDVEPLTRHHVEDNNLSKNVQGNDVAPSEKSASAPAEEVGCNVPTGNSSNFVGTDPQNEVGVAFSQRSILAGVEQFNQPKTFGTQEIICVDLPDSRESVPGEIQPVELNQEVAPDVPETVPNEIVDYANPVGLSKNTSNKGIDKGDGIGLPDALENLGDETDTGGSPLVGQILEPSEQTRASPHHCALLLPQVSEDQIHRGSISDVIQDQDAQVVEEQNTSPFEVAASEHVDTVTILRSNIELQDRDAPATEDQVTSQIEVANSELVVDTVNPVQDQSVQVVEKQNTSPFEVASSEHVSLSNIELQDRDPPDTSQIEVGTSGVIDIVTPEDSSEKLQYQDAPVVEDQVALQIEVANSELVDSVNPVQSIVDAPPIENCEELHILSIDVSPSCNEPPSIEVESQSHNLERNSSQTTEVAATVVLSHESASQLGENWEPRSNHLGIGSESEVAHETSVEPSISSQNNVAMSQTVASTVELAHQAGLQLGSLRDLYGSSYLFSYPNHQDASWSSPPLFASSLQHDLEKISKEIEQLKKSREDMMLQLKSDREKEIQETLAQIHNKYDLKVQDAEAEFSFKKSGLDKNQNKLLMNKFLSVAFSSTCLGLWSFGLPEMQQGTPSSSMQHQHHQPLQHLVRPPPMATALQPAPGQPIAYPNLQAMQQLLLPQSMRHSPVTASPVQPAQHAALSFGSTSRPPVISAITPTANSRFGGEIRSLAPHLQPRAASSTPTATFPSFPRHFQQLRPSQPLQSPPPAMPPPLAPQHPSTFQNRPQQQGEPPAVLNRSLSALEYLMDVDDRAHVPGNRVSSCLPEISSTFGSLEQSYLATLGNVQGNQTSSAVVTDAICLSDDD